MRLHLQYYCTHRRTSDVDLECGHCEQRWQSWRDVVEHLNVPGRHLEPPCRPELAMSANPRPLFTTPGEQPDASLVHRSIQLDPVQLAALEAGVPTASTSACTVTEVPVAVESTIPEATFLHMPVLTGDAAGEEICLLYTSPSPRDS